MRDFHANWVGESLILAIPNKTVRIQMNFEISYFQKKKKKKKDVRASAITRSFSWSITVSLSEDFVEISDLTPRFSRLAELLFVRGVGEAGSLMDRLVRFRDFSCTSGDASISASFE
jgi:hypothetical protein